MKSRTICGNAFAGIAFILFCSCTSESSRHNSDASRPGGTEIRNSAASISGEKQSGAAQAEDGPLAVIGHLEFRDKVVTIFSSSSGPRYTIATKEGKMIAARLGEEELLAEFPDLYQSIKTGEAGNDASLQKAHK